MKPDEQPTESNILIVDDTPANVLLLVRILTDRGYHTRSVLSGEQALQTACEDPPDLILLDINMPTMNGYEVCAQLKADAILKDIPVIFISALSDTADKMKAFQAGGVDYVTKPFQIAEVVARVHTHLFIRKLQVELEKQNLQLIRNYEQLKNMEMLRDNLTHMVVHDMRSPLMVVSGSFEVINREPDLLSSNQKKFTLLGHSSCRQLIEMTSTLLDVSRMEAGQMPLHRLPCDILEVAQASVDFLSVIALGKNLRIRVTGSSTIVTVDRDITSRIFVNLLANAIKFSKEDAIIDVSISFREESVHVEVTDHGYGIPPEYHQRIFEKFGQAEPHANNKKYSTGLGLTFCKLAVETHGGSIGVESEVGKGSTFWFDLPPQLPAI